MNNPAPLWEDRQVKFDIPNVQRKLRGGEKIFEIIDLVEDSKGNPGDRGRIVITNLRLIWFSVNNVRFTLSIGYGNILTMNTKTVVSKFRGTTQALYILSASANSRFEFIFTSFASSGMQHFTSVFDVFRKYQASTLFRELKLRGAVVASGQLKVLPNEQVFNQINGVYNLSSDQGNLGCLTLSNVRIVWFADMNEMFNISLPYVQVANIKVRESKYGPALVIQTADTGGSYVLGFRVDPAERLHEVYKELGSLFSVYATTPVFGVNYERKTDDARPVESFSVEEFEEIDTKEAPISNKFTAYLTEGDLGKARETFYCKELGFAMEKLIDGYTIKDLWEVIPSNQQQ